MARDLVLGLEVVLADGQALVRAGIRLLLQAEGQAEVIGEASLTAYRHAQQWVSAQK